MRFLSQRGHFSAENDRVKPNAFMPPSTHPQTSVYRVTGLQDDERWELGDRHLPRIKAGAMTTPELVSEAGLEVDPDNRPERHAVIVGWAAGEDRKGERILKAQRLAADAALVIRPA